ncbi:MAG: Fic family protein [Holophagales bacterium]|nr:Fic family protein [Holophagales bacterium]
MAWRWEEKDLGFRFRIGKGTRNAEYYQGRAQGEFYIVPAIQRKLSPDRVKELAALVATPPVPQVVANPWNDYHQDWDWVTTADGIFLNWAGCLDKTEIDRREDEGVQRAMELVAGLVERDEPVPLSIDLLKRIHKALMGEIYPFAGAWRTVTLHKGDGPTKWPLPPGGLQRLMDVLEREVLSRSPFISEDDGEVFLHASEVMNEVLAIHPFREGNGRTAFLLGNLILMQNDLLPLTTYERRRDQERYFAACEAGRLQKEYEPLAALLEEWEDRARVDWRKSSE